MAVVDAPPHKKIYGFHGAPGLARPTAPSGPNVAFTGMLLRWTCWSLNATLKSFPPVINKYDMLSKQNPRIESFSDPACSIQTIWHDRRIGQLRELQTNRRANGRQSARIGGKQRLESAKKTGWNCPHPEVLVECRIYSVRDRVLNGSSLTPFFFHGRKVQKLWASTGNVRSCPQQLVKYHQKGEHPIKTKKTTGGLAKPFVAMTLPYILQWSIGTHHSNPNPNTYPLVI